MKTRLGFVSNSSSTSFCIFGTIIPEENNIDDMYGALKAFNTCHGTKLEYACGISYEYIVVGHSPDSMKDDETLLQFRTRTDDAIQLFMEENGKPEFKANSSFVTDGGYNG